MKIKLNVPAEFLREKYGVWRIRYFTEPYQKSGNFHEVKMEYVIVSGAYK